MHTHNTWVHVHTQTHTDNARAGQRESFKADSRSKQKVFHAKSNPIEQRRAVEETTTLKSAGKCELQYATEINVRCRSASHAAYGCVCSVCVSCYVAVCVI